MRVSVAVCYLQGNSYRPLNYSKFELVTSSTLFRVIPEQRFPDPFGRIIH